MRLKDAGLMALGITLGVTAMATMAACVPDPEPTSATAQPTQQVTETTIDLPAGPNGYGYVLPPCEQEDSENCFWDGSVRGSGNGWSFVNINGENYYYAEPKVAPTGPVQDFDKGTLECGISAIVATDQDGYGNNWAYCEPNGAGQ